MRGGLLDAVPNRLCLFASPGWVVSRQNSVRARKSEISPETLKRSKSIRDRVLRSRGAQDPLGIRSIALERDKDGVRPCVSELSAWIKQPGRNDDAALLKILFGAAFGISDIQG